MHIEVDTLSNYYGVIREILILDFHKFKLALFRCDWANVASGVKKVDGFTVVNLHEGLSKIEPFILASHAQQVFYSRDTDKSNWYAVLKAPLRGFNDLELFDPSIFTTAATGDQDCAALNIDDEFDGET